MKDIADEIIADVVKRGRDFKDVQDFQSFINQKIRKIHDRNPTILSELEIKKLHENIDNNNIKNIFIALIERGCIPEDTMLSTTYLQYFDNLARALTEDVPIIYNISQWKKDHDAEIKEYKQNVEKDIEKDILGFVFRNNDQLAKNFSIKDLYETPTRETTISETISNYASFNKETMIRKISSSAISELEQNIINDHNLFDLACYHGYVDIANAIIDKYNNLDDKSQILAKILTKDIPLLCLSTNKEASVQILNTLLNDSSLSDQIKTDIRADAALLAHYIILSYANTVLNQQFKEMIRDNDKIVSEILKQLLERKDIANIEPFLNSQSFKSMQSEINVENEIFEYALKHDREDLIDYLISNKYGAYVNQKNVLNHVFEVKNQLFSEIETMEKHSLNIKSSEKITEIKSAIDENKRLIKAHIKTINKFLDLDSQPNTQNKTLSKALDVGAMRVDILLNLYQDINESYSGTSKEEHQKTFDKMLHHQHLGLEPFVSLNETSENLLILATKYNDFKYFEFIKDKSKKYHTNNNLNWSEFINACDDKGNCPIIYAAKSKDGIFEELIAQGAELFDKKSRLICNKDGVTPLMGAYFNANEQVINYLKLNRKNPEAFIAELNRTDKAGNNCLHFLTNKFDLTSSGVLFNDLLKHVDINSKNLKGETPLIKAVLEKNLSLVTELLKNGADVNIADNFGNTPLIYAAMLDNKELVEKLLEQNNLDVNKKNTYGISAFYILAARDNLEVIKPGEIIDNTKSILPKNIANQIPLLLEKNDCTGLAQKLLARGADGFAGNQLDNIMTSIITTYFLTISPHIIKTIVNTALPALSPISFVYDYASTAMQIIGQRTVYNNMFNYIKLHVSNYAKEGTNLDKKIDIKDKIMIGNYKESFLSVSFGKALNTQADQTLYFTNSKEGIFTLEDLLEDLNGKKNENSRKDDWFISSHEDLRTKYINIKQAIANQPWYNRFPFFWKAAAFNSIEKEIIAADKVLLNDNKAKTLFDISIETYTGSERFESESFLSMCNKSEPNLIKILASPKQAKQLLRSIIDNENNKDIKKLDEIIQLVVDKKIIVPVEVYFNFLQFKTLQDSLKLEHKKQLFLKNNKAIDKLPEFSDRQIKAIEKKSQVSQKPSANVAKSKNTPYVAIAYAVPYFIITAQLNKLTLKEEHLNEAVDSMATVTANISVNGFNYVMSKLNFEYYVKQNNIADKTLEAAHHKKSSYLTYIGNTAKYVLSNPFITSMVYGLVSSTIEKLLQENAASTKELDDLLNKATNISTPAPLVPNIPNDKAIEKFITPSADVDRSSKTLDVAVEEISAVKQISISQPEQVSNIKQEVSAESVTPPEADAQINKSQDSIASEDEEKEAENLDVAEEILAESPTEIDKDQPEEASNVEQEISVDSAPPSLDSDTKMNKSEEGITSEDSDQEKAEGTVDEHSKEIKTAELEAEELVVSDADLASTAAAISENNLEESAVLEDIISKETTNKDIEENAMLLQDATQNSGITTPDGTQTTDAQQPQNDVTAVCSVELQQAVSGLIQHGVQEHQHENDKKLEAAALDNSVKQGMEKSK